MAKIWCPGCDQGWVVAGRLKANGLIFYVCEECDSTWLSADAIGTSDVSNLRELVRPLGLEGLWTEFDVIPYGNKVVCPRCAQDWLYRVSLPKLDRTAILCPECDALWTSEAEALVGSVGSFEDYSSFMVRHGRSPPESKEEIRILAPLEVSGLVDLSFERTYGCEILHELPSAATEMRHFFPEEPAGQDGLLLRVRPRGEESWIGLFAFGKSGTAGVDRVVSLPNPEKLCVVSHGAGYVFATQHPQSWEAVPSTPITDVRAVPSARIVVFASPTELVAYGPKGVQWRTKRLDWDDVKILAVTPSQIIGEYRDISTKTAKRFELDLATGAQRGGVDG